MSSIEGQKQAERATIHSLEVALNVLSKMVEKGRPLALKELSELCSEPPSKIHRYLSTLMSLEFVSQTHRHGAYTLGRGCIRLGLAAMRQVDLFQRIESGLERLAQQTTCHSFMSIWTTAGPIIIRWIFADDAVPVNTMPGQVFSVSRSSAGRIFAAFLPKSQTESLLQRELAALGETVTMPSPYGSRSTRHEGADMQRRMASLNRTSGRFPCRFSTGTATA